MQDLSSLSPNIVIGGSAAHPTIDFNSTGLVSEQAAAVVTTETCGQTISALDIVYMDPVTGKVLKADKDVLLSASALGMAKQAGLLNDEIEVLQFGIFEDATWAWTPTDLIFLTSNGSTSSTAPGTGFLTRIGKAINATTILVSIEAPVAL